MDTRSSLHALDLSAVREPDDVDGLLDGIRSAFHRAEQISVARVTELAHRISSLEQDLRDMEQLVVAAERQAAHLASLYVATYQLHASLDPAEVKSAIAEIAVDLLGASECALLMSSDAGDHELVHLVTGAGAPAPFDGARYAGGDPLVDASLGDGALRFGAGADAG